MTMSKLKKWELLSEEDVSPSKYFPIFRQTVKLPNGKIIDDFYVSKLGDAIVVVAITSEKKILIVKQYKQGLGDFSFEVPAGKIDKEGSPLENAQRELKEETGFTSKRWIEIGQISPVTTKSTARVYGFIALDIEDTGKVELDENEEIETFQMTLSEIEEFIKTGQIIESDCIAMIYKAKLTFPEHF